MPNQAPMAGLATKRSLPNGPCTHRDQAFGACGCNQFWDKCTAELHDASTDERPSSERSTWCVCGHHACFHLREARTSTATVTAIDRLQPTAAVPQQRFQAICDGRCQLQPDSQCNIHGRARRLAEDISQLQPSQPLQSVYLKTSQGVASQADQRRLRNEVSQLKRTALRDTISQTSTSGLPRVPSVCLLSNDRRPRADADVEVRQQRTDVGRNHQHLTGLGLSLVNSMSRQPSVLSTVPDESERVSHGARSESELPSTRANSFRTDLDRVASPPRPGSLGQILEFNRTLHVNVDNDTIPDTYNPDEFIQSATEVATPSNANTPDLGAVDQAAQESKRLVDRLTRLISQPDRQNSQGSRPASAPSVSAASLPPTNAAATSQEQLEQALRSASPQVLQNLVSYLNPLHNLLNSIPNVSNSMKEVMTRLDYLENQSFNHVQPEDLQQQFELYDGRLLELEHRMDEHEALHRAIDADQSSNSFGRRALSNVAGSFGSIHSLQSSSSALAHGSMPRKEIETEFEGIKDRLEVLESTAMPTLTNPWEVEVILLPWGPELRGIWFSPDEPMHDSTKAVTQEAEEWTQHVHFARKAGESRVSSDPSRSGSHSHGGVSLASSLAFTDTESGWSSQAISTWAAFETEDMLFPKACGSNNIVYKRLQSRGFIRDVALSSANSTDIQTALSRAFSDMLDELRFTEEDTDSAIESCPGLRASFIPLRKVLKESRLRFLTPAELSNSALWSAQFLTSGVMMRVSGGKKRLYVTPREAYLQRNSNVENVVQNGTLSKKISWTWPEIRQLPRFQPDMDSQMEGNDEPCQPQVPEADAKEACWAFIETYDLPPASATSSFQSNQSAPVQLSMRPVTHASPRSITPSSILKNGQPQPISPLSGNPPLRPGHRRARTFSATILDPVPQTSAKRRLNTSPVKSPKNEHYAPRTPSTMVSNPKRRRVATPSHPRRDPDAGAAAPSRDQDGQVVVWNNTSPRTREPPSPFQSSHPGLRRTASDVTNRSQKSVAPGAVVGKATPFAYATPYSGPLTGAGGFGVFKGRGDTEPDDDDQGDDGEQSWHGVDDGEDASGSDSDSGSDDDDIGGELEAQASFSGDDSGFGSEDEDDDDDSDDSEHEDEVFDALLGALEN